MGFLNCIQTIIQTALDQLTAPGSTTIHFTNHLRKQARAWGLAEKDATDVYYHGVEVKESMLVKEYNG